MLQSSQAQFWEVGGWVGSSFYFGDLTPALKFRRPGLAFGAQVRRNFNARLSTKIGLQYAHLSAFDKDSPEAYAQARNLSFKSHIFEGNWMLEFNFLPFKHGSKDNFTPYLSGGVAIYYFNPTAEYEGFQYKLRNLGTEGQTSIEAYSLVEPALVFGGGFKFDIGYALSMNIDISSRFLFTDYLDDVSGRYPDNRTLANNRGAISAALSDRSGEVNSDLRVGGEGRQRGDSKPRDSYLVIGVGIMYHFNEIVCPANW